MTHDPSRRRTAYAVTWLALALAVLVSLLTIRADPAVIAVVLLAWLGGVVTERLRAGR